MPDKLYCFCGWPLTVKCLDVVQPKLLSFYRGGNVCRANSGWCRGLCRTIDLRGSGAKFKFNEEQRLFLLHTSASYPHAIFTNLLEVHDSHSRMSIGVNYETKTKSQFGKQQNQIFLLNQIGYPWATLAPGGWLAIHGKSRSMTCLSMNEIRSPMGYNQIKSKWKSRFRKLAEDD